MRFYLVRGVSEGVVGRLKKRYHHRRTATLMKHLDLHLRQSRRDAKYYQRLVKNLAFHYKRSAGVGGDPLPTGLKGLT